MTTQKKIIHYTYMLYNIGLFFLEDRNFKVCIRNELLDHAKEAFRYAGRAFRDAVEFESDIKKQALLYYGASVQDRKFLVTK